MSAPVILLVDDEENYRLSAKAFIEKGYAKKHGVTPTVLAASTIDEAEALLKQKAGEVDVVVTDADLPGRNGFDLARSVGGRIPLVMISARDPAMFRGQDAGVTPPPVFLTK